MAARRQTGVTLIAVLFLSTALAIGMAAVAVVWQSAIRREKEIQLLFVGDQYRRAIESYRRSTPGGIQHDPPALDDLLLDRRFPKVVRHLRQRYADPITGEHDWGLVREGDGIIGIHSLSLAAPLKQTGFITGYSGFAHAASYRDWVFLASRPDAQTGGGLDSMALEER